MRDSICNDCAKRTRCDMAEIGRSPLAISACYGYEKGNPTNADRIRGMTDEELAQYMGDVQTWGGCPNHGARNCTENCADCWLDWLKQEVPTNG